MIIMIIMETTKSVAVPNMNNKQGYETADLWSAASRIF